MRIAFVVQDFLPDVGGTHVYNAEYAKRLAERGHDVKVFTWSNPDPEASRVDAALPFEVRRVAPVRGRGGLDPRGLRQALTAWGSEVSLVSGSAAAMARAIRSVARCTPVVVSVHDLRDKGRIYGRARCAIARRRYGYQRATRIVADSEYNRGCLVRLGVPEEKIRIVHPGVDTGSFVPDPGAGARLRAELGLSGHRILLTISRLAHNKGHARVIGLLPRLLASVGKLRYVIVGDGEMREALARRAAALGGADLVYFAGRVDDVRPWYNACDVFVMPSTPHAHGLKAGEGFGIVYAEAGACAKPVVASSSGGGPEIVAEGETGRVIDPDDDVGLARALEEILTDPALGGAMGARARERVRRFDWRCGSLLLESALEEAAASAQAAPER